jgi:hypothetical protein
MHFDLRQIAEGKKPFPDSAARRHHFVPAFSLAQFANPPGGRKGRLFQLDVRTGKPQRTSPDDAAFEIDLYSYGPPEERNNRMEVFLSIVEKHAARCLAKLRDDPGSLSPQDRETIAYFLGFQEARTPAGLLRRERMSQTVFELTTGMELATPEGFRAEYERRIGADQSEEEIEQLRLRMRKQLEGGQVRHQEPKVASIKLILESAHEMARVIYGLDWVVLEAEGAEFVTSDRPVSMADPSPPHPWTGNGWASSPNACSFYPLTPSKGLLLKQGDCGIEIARSRPDQVRRLNLLTYGWAAQRIFGASQATVTHVRKQAKRYPRDIQRPRAAKQVILEPADPNDPTVGQEYVRRGWPRGFTVKDDDGIDRFMTYTVVDLEAEPGAMARVSTEVGERVARAAKMSQKP